MIKHSQVLHQNIAPLLTKQALLSPADVHQLRVTVKELQALWQLLKPHLAKDQADVASSSIARAARLLADVRDQQVQLVTLEERISKAGAEELPSLRRAREQMIAHSGCTKKAVMTADIGSLFAQDLARWQSLELDCGRRELVGKGYWRLYRNARKCFRKAAASGKAKDWHRLRRWTKYLALVTPMVAKDDDDSVAARRYNSLAEKLGELHDLQLVAAALRSLPDQDSSSTCQAIEVLEKQADLLQQKCYKKSRRLFSSQKRSEVVRSVLE
jgi:CHAD domain-containing protein